MTYPELTSVHRCPRPTADLSPGDRWACPDCSAAWSVTSVEPVAWRWERP